MEEKWPFLLQRSYCGGAPQIPLSLSGDGRVGRAKYLLRRLPLRRPQLPLEASPKHRRKHC